MFGSFLRELNEVYRAIGTAPLVVAKHHVPMGHAADGPNTGEDQLSIAERADWIARALATLAPADRLAVQLFVIDGMGAAEVAQTVGWPNAKAVYNRVYRALAALREVFHRQGVRRDDL